MFDGYSIASGSTDITPQARIPLAGYSALRKATFERVADPLEANVIVLRRGVDAVVFVAFDLMYVGAFLRDGIFKALSGRIRRESIFTSAGHTHSAPPTEDSLPILGTVSPEYRDSVVRSVSELALRLLDGPFVPVTLEYLEGNASHSVNRRKKVFGLSRNYPFIGPHVGIEPNLSGRRDDTIRMIRIRDGSGKDVAACWSYACHPVGFPRLNDLSAEYPGVVRHMIRASFGNIPVVFWQGFSGNIGPLRATHMAGSPSSQVTYGFEAATMEEWNAWASGLGDCVAGTALGRGRPIQGPISCSVRALSLHELGLSSSSEKQLRLHEIRLGRDLVICGLNAEVAVEYVEIFRELHAPAHVIPVGCVGDVFGYLPVDEMVREGGYEAKGFLRRFGLRGKFFPNVSEIVTERLFRGAQRTEQSKAQGETTDQRGAGAAERDSSAAH
jgi:hypothetical protein